MNILVTGAYGYIGSKLVSNLRAEGHKIGLIVRRKPSFELAWTEGLEVLAWDMTGPYPGNLSTPYDLFIHTAGANDVDSDDPREALLNTALTTRNAIGFCRRTGISRFVYLSTFQIFGTAEGHISDESQPRCVNDYALTHWFAEEYLRTAERNGILNYVITRPTNVYGAPLDKRIDRWTLVPSCFCKAAFESRQITLRSSGRQYRNFVHLDAVVHALVFLAYNFDRAAGRAYNIVGSEVSTIREVVDKVIAAYEKIFLNRCELIVASDDPKATSPLHVDANNLVSLGYRPLKAATVDEEINTIFNLLKE